MSVAVDLGNAFLAGADATWTAVRPYKEAVFGLMTIIGGALAAFFGAYKKQGRRPEEALDEAAATRRITTVTVTQLHLDDRKIVGELQEAVVDMTRAVKKLTTTLIDEADERERHARHRGEPAT
ncbi:MULTISPECIES: hypothetical protein [unclassified Methylobacterium]|uniref:hypothetical protein n=1 Tax=unclassified Methylobacterium TaxID=2615210 RepID=UPI00226A2C82|nr:MULTISPECIES: hypothetical protein [unclassified Methylobacterium]